MGAPSSGTGVIALCGAAWLSLLPAPAFSQVSANNSPAEARQVEEIVVTARRSGVPVWRVTGPTTTLIIVGGIEEVSRDTKWDPASLTSALKMADRVMFPQEEEFKASPVAMIGYLVRLARMARLPKGQSLQNMMTPQQFQRLVALRDKGVLKKGFERTHPLHLALALDDVIDGKGYGVNATEYAMRTVKKYRLKQVPIPRRSIKQPINAVFKSRPKAHIPCLLGFVSLMEAGGAQVVKARSDAWAQRRVPEVVSSPATRVFSACSLDEYLESQPDWRGAARRLMSQPQVTVAVFDLASVAQPGGLLDEFAAKGFEISGPAWR
jgi:hypothetical protein